MGDAGADELQERAGALAAELDHGHVGVEHLIGALLAPAEPTIASRVLQGLGATTETWLAWWRVATGSEVEGWGRPITPALQRLLGVAEGIVLGQGVAWVTDEIALLALCYDRSSRIPQHLEELELDPRRVVAALAAEGVAVPKRLPPEAAPPLQPSGSCVTFPAEDRAAVLAAITAEVSMQDGLWGWNFEDGDRCSVEGEEQLDLESIIRRAVRDPSTVRVEDAR